MLQKLTVGVEGAKVLQKSVRVGELTTLTGSIIQFYYGSRCIGKKKIYMHQLVSLADGSGHFSG